MFLLVLIILESEKISFCITHYLSVNSWPDFGLQGKAVNSPKVVAVRNEMRRLTNVDFKEGRGAASGGKEKDEEDEDEKAEDEDDEEEVPTADDFAAAPKNGKVMLKKKSCK